MIRVRGLWRSMSRRSWAGVSPEPTARGVSRRVLWFGMTKNFQIRQPLKNQINL